MTPRRCFPLCSPSLFLVLSKPKIPASVFKTWLPQLRCSVDRWIRLAGWLLSTADDWSFAPEKVGLGLGKRTVLQLQSPSDILLSSHLHVCSILPHIHLVAPGTQATFSVGRIWLLYKVPVVRGSKLLPLSGSFKGWGQISLKRQPLVTRWFPPMKSMCTRWSWSSL